MRKSLVLSFLSLILSTGYVFGQNSLNVGSATSGPGTDVQIAISLNSDKNIAGVQFDLLFDQTKLQIKTAANGSNASAMTSVGLDVAGANTSGKLSVSLVDFSFSNPIAAGTDKQVYLVTFTIAAAASGDIPLTLSGVSLSDELAADVAVSLNAGKVTVESITPPPPPPPSGGGNYLEVTEAAGDPGADVQVKVLVTTDKNVAGAQFELMFDKSKLQVKTVANGAAATAMTNVGLDIAGANTTGKLSVSLVDFSFSNPIAAGTDKEVLLVTFSIAGTAPAGDVALTLGGVSLSDELAGEITATVTNGKITISGGTTPPWTPPTPPTDQNLVIFYPVEAKSGDAVTTDIDINALVQIAGAQFRVAFDKSLVTITEVKAGAGASAFTLVGLNVADANTNGYFDVSMVDFSFASPIKVGMSHLLSVGMTFQKAGAAKFTVTGIEMSDPNAASVNFTSWTYDLPTPVAEEDTPGMVLPKAFSLSQNSPNPFNPSTTVNYQVAGNGVSASRVTIRVFNLRGQQIATLVDEMKPAGNYTIQWNGLTDSGARVASGVYFYRMQTDKFTQTRKMVILK